MPAVSVAFAEVEDRLAEIRHRLNRQLLVRILSPAVAIVLLSAAAVIAAALRGSSEAFAWTLYTAVVVAAGTSTVAALLFWRRRSSLAAAARVADRRARTKDRLPTALWLRDTGRPSAMASLLASDTINLSSRWEPARLAPWRLQRALLFPLASLAILAAVPFLTRSVPPPALSPSQPGNLAAVSDAPHLPTSQTSPHALPGVGRGEVGDRSGRRGQEAGTGAPSQLGPESGKAGDELLERSESGEHLPSQPMQTDAEAVAMPSRLQDLIRDAFDGESAERARREQTQTAKATGAGEPWPRGPTEATDQGKANEGEQAAEDGDKPGGRNSQGEAMAPADAPGRKTQNEPPAAGAVASGGEHHGAGKAGSGSSPETLFGNGSAPEGGVAADSPAQTGSTFKVTLTSFLHATQGVEDEGSSGKGGAAAAPQHRGRLPLSLDQAADDAMRRAAVPPEYEDLVRRIFSSRPGPAAR